MDKIRASLGGTADEVAATLRAYGIQGVRNTVRQLNPVVRNVLSKIRVDAYGLDVMQGSVLRMTFEDGRQEEAVIPPPVKQFMDRFNRGAFPDLELSPDGL